MQLNPKLNKMPNRRGVDLIFEGPFPGVGPHISEEILKYKAYHNYYRVRRDTYRARSRNSHRQLWNT